MTGEQTVVAIYNEIFEAELARGMLEANGIPAFIADRNIARIQSLLVCGSGGIRLKVAAEDEEEAREILASVL